jgi:uncharacterized alpha-E superfamily protein
MEHTSVATQTVPAEAVVMQMVMGGWIARAISDISRLNIPDVLKKHGAMSAAELVASGVAVNASALERVLRVCASVGVFTENVDGRFGPTPLSDVLTMDSPRSVKVLAQEMGGLPDASSRKPESQDSAIAAAGDRKRSQAPVASRRRHAR